MTTIPEVSEIVQTLLTTTADQVAKQTGLIQRRRQVTGAGLAQTLVLGGLAQPAATRREQQQQAAQVGMVVSVQGLEQRFTPTAVVFMRRLLEEGLQQLVSSEEDGTLLPQFNGVYLTDCTRLAWGKDGMKLGVRWEIQRGQLQASLSVLTAHDQRSPVVACPLPAGALHLGDLGFFQLLRFQQWNAQEVYWLSRFKLGTRLYSEQNTPLDVATLLATSTEPVVMAVRVGAKLRLPAYLLAAPVSESVYQQRQTRLKETARLDQRPVSQRQAACARWTIYLTNIPHLTFAQAHTLARTRWQIELLFKLWKSHGHILHSRTANPIRQQCEGFAKLLGVLIAHWLLLVSGWQPASISLLDALRLVRTYVPLVMHALSRRLLWHELLTWLRLDLHHTARRSRRRKVPLAFQLWQNFDLVLA